MALSPRLELRQGQGLVITPQLQQAIKLLQLSSVELDAYVEGELERNPLLQRDERDGDGEADAPVQAERPAEIGETALDRITATDAAADIDAAHGDLYAETSPGEGVGSAEEAGAETYQTGGAVDWSRAGRGGGFDGEEQTLEGAAQRAKTLNEHLSDQLAVAGLAGPDHLIAQVLIDGVDDGGYLRLDLDEVAERLGCAPEKVQAVLTRLQGFEPTGVFARGVAECLRLQLVERDRCDPAMAALLDNLDLLARRDMAGLRRVCAVDEEDLKEMLAELRALTPRPGAAFGGEPAAPITPDAIVRESLGGLWHVELNSDALPRLLVDQRYHARVSGGARTDADKTFVADCLASANWLVRSLDQRAKTILKVASEIVRQQDGFLAFGVEHLRPLNLKTVAEAIGMHESTVSRVTSNKYLATPRGVFEMKFFFTAAIQASDGGAAHSAESVRHRIRQLIDAEAQPDSVLSDDRIVEILNETGVDIARRTVAKYREAMRIPSSVERRRMLKEAC
ncbi:MAG TPA: RNA polymerase factor sigma-54 [Caulobacteraceae bacterium]|nr:RNA polymerase factor sigma-54 [Caulobacteraceae bacterium]